MSNATGITLAPIKGALLMRQATAQATAQATEAVTKGSYVPPSKRKEQAKVVKPPTAEELSSEQLFPSLSPMKPATPGATWGQLRSRLTSSNSFAALDTEDEPSPTVAPRMDFKNVIKERIEADIKEEEEGIRLSNITDPHEMSAAQLAENGWDRLPMPERSSKTWYHDYNERIELASPLEDTSCTDWPAVDIPKEIMNDVRKVMVFLGCPDTGIHFDDTPVKMPVWSQYSEKKARDDLLRFVGKQKMH